MPFTLRRGDWQRPAMHAGEAYLAATILISTMQGLMMLAALAAGGARRNSRPLRFFPYRGGAWPSCPGGATLLSHHT